MVLLLELYLSLIDSLRDRPSIVRAELSLSSPRAYKIIRLNEHHPIIPPESTIQKRIIKCQSFKSCAFSPHTAFDSAFEQSAHDGNLFGFQRDIRFLALYQHKVFSLKEEEVGTASFGDGPAFCGQYVMSLAFRLIFRSS